MCQVKQKKLKRNRSYLFLKILSVLLQTIHFCFFQTNNEYVPYPYHDIFTLRIKTTQLTEIINNCFIEIQWCTTVYVKIVSLY